MEDTETRERPGGGVHDCGEQGGLGLQYGLYVLGLWVPGKWRSWEWHARARPTRRRALTWRRRVAAHCAAMRFASLLDARIFMS